MNINPGLVRVLLFLACIYLLELAKEAGYISIGIQIVGVLILMAVFLFGEKIIRRFEK